MLVHPRNPAVRRIWIAVEVVAVLGGLWLGWSMFSRQPLTVTVGEISGYREDLKVWMRFNVALEIANVSGRTIGIDRIQVEPDLDAFNEAYGAAVPYLTPPLLVQNDSTTQYTAVVTLLNAAQLPERTYNVTFRIQVETEDGDVISTETRGQFDYFHDPSRRALRR